jgi:hypothetical protein
MRESKDKEKGLTRPIIWDTVPYLASKRAVNKTFRLKRPKI